jgi:hypothetical protein
MSDQTEDDSGSSEGGGGNSKSLLNEALGNLASMGCNNLQETINVVAESELLNLVFPGAKSLFSMAQIFTGKAPSILGTLLGSPNANLPSIIPNGKISGIFGSHKNGRGG